MGTRIFLVLAAVLLVLSGEASAAEFGGMRELFVYPFVQHFTWEEFGGDKRLLKEQGFLYGAGAAVTVDLLKTHVGSLTMRGKGELFGGVVDYDGHTQPPNNLSVKTDVSYFGTRQELALGWTVPINSFSLQPFAGVGYRWWLRDLHDSTAFDPSLNGGQGGAVVVSGSTEEWESLYTKVGMAFSHTINDSWRVFAEAGAKYPFYNSNTVDIVGAGSKTVRPESRWSAFTEIGARYKWFRPAIFYEGYRTGQSKVVDTGLVDSRGNKIGIFQPQSDEDVIGVSFSYCFR